MRQVVTNSEGERESSLWIDQQAIIKSTKFGTRLQFFVKQSYLIPHHRMPSSKRTLETNAT